MQLDAAIHHLRLQLARDQLGGGRVLGGQLAGVEEQHALVNIGLRHVEIGAHLGHLEARVLERADRLSERAPFLHILEGQVERSLRSRHEADCGDQPLLRQETSEIAEAFTRLAEQICLRNFHVVEEQLGGVLRF